MPLLDTLKSFPFFQKISDENLACLLPYLHEASFEEGSWIIEEGGLETDLILIVSGSVEVIKKSTKKGKEAKIGTLNAGESTGEMSFLEKMPRSASLRALSKCKVIFLKIEMVQSDPKCQFAYKKIYEQMSHQVSTSLTHVEDALIQSMKQKLIIKRAQNKGAHTIVSVFALLVAYLNLQAIFQAYLPNLFFETSNTFDLLTIFVLATASICFIVSSGHKRQFYGLTFENWYQNTTEAIFISIPLIGVMILWKWFLISHIPKYFGQDLFVLRTAGINPKIYRTQIEFFMISIPFQELFSRSLLQSSFYQFFAGPGQTILAIVMPNIVFYTLSFYFFNQFVLMTTLFGIVWGYMYHKQRSILGCVISHLIVGFVGCLIFGLD